MYVHIPFCIRKCHYCDFLSFSSKTEDKMAYVHALTDEISLWKQTVSALQVDTIFIGGGTPTVLDMPQMDVLFAALHNAFYIEQVAEFTVECNPGTVTEEKLRFMKSAGVNRLSIGMQSTFDAELKELGRIHTNKEFLESYELARRMGFDNINVDMMSGIPGQTLESYEKSLKQMIALSPEHISSYSLIIEEGTPFYERYKDHPPVDEDTDRKMYERTDEILSAAGYTRYEISNYAKAGKECIHNLKYWQRKPYLGVGLGAASCIAHKRFRNMALLKQYKNKIRNHELPVCETEELTKQDEMAEYMYLGLRCMKGISITEFEQNFGEDFRKKYGVIVEQLSAQGLLNQKEDMVYLTKRGIDVSNRVFAEFI